MSLQNLHGETPLHLACFVGDLNMVRFLILHGASMNISNVDGETGNLIQLIFLF